MSLDKAIAAGKEHRKPYRRSKRFDRTCRPHGGGKAHPCPWCEQNRLHADTKARGMAELIMRDDV